MCFYISVFVIKTRINFSHVAQLSRAIFKSNQTIFKSKLTDIFDATTKIYPKLWNSFALDYVQANLDIMPSHL